MSTVPVPCSYGVGLGVLFASHGVIRACLLTFVAQATRWFQVGAKQVATVTAHGQVEKP